jgi:hypothetical protein
MINLKKNLAIITFVIIFLLGSAFVLYANSYAIDFPPELQPQLILPENEQVINTLTPSLSWNEVKNAEFYCIIISHDPGENLIVLNLKTHDLTIQVHSGLLDYFTSYYWKVQAGNSAGVGPWSDFYSFQTFKLVDPNGALDNLLNKNNVSKNLSVKQIKFQNKFPNPITSKIIKDVPPELQPQLLLPENEQFINEINPTLSWGEVTNATYFHIMISHYDGENLVEVIIKTTQLQIEVPYGVLDYNTSYFWKVQPLNNSGAGPWSEISNFQTNINPNVGADNAINKNNISSGRQIKFYSNYPNPFNPTTKINYEILTNSFVKITVYNVLGKEVKTLVNSYQNAGMHTVEFNASSLASGIYFSRLESNGYVTFGKMNLIK